MPVKFQQTSDLRNIRPQNQIIFVRAEAFSRGKTDYCLNSFESHGSTEDTHRLLRMELRQLARCLLSRRFAGLAPARILCRLFSGCRSGFYISRCPNRNNGSSVGRNDSRQLSVYLQASPSNHPHLPSPRLRRRAKFVPSRDRAPRTKVTRHPHSAPAFADTGRRKIRAAQVSRAIAAGFSLCH